ncbi:CU044_2847 family protein [Plantactinospora endophytica]|uniref:CU044_2847 family protein n=1 Tax=Plantactinospora endophytica TaxID=673535 RepID=UPI001944322E|nr:CU044_2847 family protein [Plantactinospora endophytica]
MTIVPIGQLDGGPIFAEVVVNSDGDVGADRFGRLTELGGEISRISRFVAGAVRDNLPDPPRRYGVQFGIKLSAETGPLVAVLTKATAEANLVVHLEWEEDNPPESPTT